MKITDTDRINWLERNSQSGFGLINDDAGHFAIVFDGVQSVSFDTKLCDMTSSFFINKKEFFKTARKAIDHQINNEV